MGNIDRIIETIENAEEMVSASISMDDVLDLDGEKIDYRVFYAIMTLPFCEEYTAYGECFFEGQFCYKVKIKLTDEEEIDVRVQRNTFEHEFLNENEIEIDTLECIDLLRKSYKEGYLISGLSIVPPEYVEESDELFADREMYVRGICDGGQKGVEFGGISEVSEESIRRTPQQVFPLEQDREWIDGEAMAQVVESMDQMESIDNDTFKFITFLTRMWKENKISEDMMKLLAGEWNNSY